VVLGEVFGARLGGFFSAESDEVNGDGEDREEVGVIDEAGDHSGHGAFGV